MDIEIIKRLNNIINLIKNNDEGCSIKEISEKLNIPINIVKKDMEILVYNYEFDMQLYSNIDDLDYEKDEFDEDVKWFISKIDEDKITLALTPLEMMSFQLFAESMKEPIKKINNKAVNILVKNKSNVLNNDQKQLLMKLEKSMEKNNIINITYKNKQGEFNNFKVCPLGIVYYEFESLWYVIGTWEEESYYYRLDRVKSVAILRETFEYPKDFNIKDRMCNIWGMEFGKEYKVKVKFKNHGHVFEKVKRDLYNRKNGQLYEKDGELFYEDTVIGINSFKMWIRSFGSSAVVIEPVEVRQQIIEAVKEAYKLYRDENEIEVKS
ncbi:WYL domain-containing protein [Clostridium ganghwense]|uniref:WYL domain-containing protein n=1 Tax=Clostridium ganghwense TaxID=312089 RepID=A0ABT4CKQ4_9CLOT|nr:WYL domain-containing protein [Clostridium ganghwense]MCY6369513.1 WYL domain-containing protein [Clostridium ganghwense]